MDFLDRINLKLNYNRVGEDTYGNFYYESKRRTKAGVTKRIVRYKGFVEPTLIPPMWHAWVHYNKETVPSSEDEKSYSWQKNEGQPNTTGLVEKEYSASPRKKVSAEYSAWLVNK